MQPSWSPIPSPLMARALHSVRSALKRFNSSAVIRIYTFRAVLLLSVATIMADVFVLDFFPDPIIYPLCLGTIFHHIFMLYPWRINLTLADIILVKMELIGFCFALWFYAASETALLLALLATSTTALCFSLYFRYTGYTCGPFNLLSGCDSTQPPYQPTEILLGRSVMKPLVRGESRTIAFFRAIILASLCFVIPAFGSYVALVAPFQARVMTRNIKTSQAWENSEAFFGGAVVGGDSDLYPAAFHLNQENITMAFFYIAGQITVDTPPANVTVARTFQDNAPVICPYSWSDLSLSFEAYPPLPGDLIGILYVKPGQGDPREVNSYTKAIPLMAGSHLAAILSRKQRDLYSKNAQWGIFSFVKPLRSIIVTPVLLLQPDPVPPDLAASSVSLRLRMRNDIQNLPAEVVQDYTDSSVLDCQLWGVLDVC
ncbi:hypothetical protein B0H19DRAFT_1099174 [Mycena capillaripes]|nr:hypothetical protein B0H19DRAFT_1099174 [Mycena capillaripes]